MKIVSICKQKDKKDRYSVLFDDGAEIIASAEAIAELGIYSGRELTSDEFVEMSDNVALSLARATALRILENRNISVSEMERRLVEKGAPTETAKEVSQWLVKIGLLNDEEYAGMIVNHYCDMGYGLARIKNEFHRRGIPREIWEEALSQVRGMDEAAYTLLKKKLRGSQDKADMKRAYDYLKRRGFNYEQVDRAMKRIMESSGDNLDMEV